MHTTMQASRPFPSRDHYLTQLAHGIAEISPEVGAFLG